MLADMTTPSRLMATLLPSIQRRLAQLRNDEEGQGLVEYALILVLIAVVVIVILTVVGQQVNNVFSNVSSAVG